MLRPMRERSDCRSCGGELASVLSLGNIFVSNFVHPHESDGVRAPLDLVLCGSCSLLQLGHTVEPEILYQTYWYRSGTNSTMRGALANIATTAELLAHVAAGDAVLDTGCNDGTLLASYESRGAYKIGFDPAQNLAPFSRQVADKIVVGFFDAASYLQDPDLGARRPKVITSIAMFYDLDEPGRFVEDIKAVLHPDGVWVVQMSYLPLMMRDHEIGNVCHEHLTYYSLASFERVLAPRDMEIVDVELNDVNGGSLRAYVRNRSASASGFGDASYRALAAKRVDLMREQEAQLRLGSADTYRDFAMWVGRIRDDVVGYIRTQAGQGRKVYVYGASTKGNTVLQYYGLNHSDIMGAAERNPDKWGRVTVGSRIPIVSEEEARRARPDYFLVLPWHFLQEFQEREKSYLTSGGRFIMPAPHFTLI
jgi:NDP-4-keto-2,6-dideoxyhexose 3-C-methyltransferase